MGTSPIQWLWTKKVRARASTFRYLCAFLIIFPLFFIFLLMDTIFEQFLLENSFQWSKIHIDRKKCAHAHCTSTFRHLCAFLFIFPTSTRILCVFLLQFSTFLQTAFYGYHFLRVFNGELIPMIKTKIKSKKCARMQALLGTICSNTFRLFCLYLHFIFFKWSFIAIVIQYCIYKQLRRCYKYNKKVPKFFHWLFMDTIFEQILLENKCFCAQALLYTCFHLGLWE